MRVFTEKQKQDARDRAIAYRIKNRQMVLEKKRLHYRNNRLSILARFKEVYQESGRAKFIERYYANHEESIKRNREKREKNIVAARARDRAWYAKNRERHALAAKMDRINNPEKYRLLDKREYQKRREKILARRKAESATPAGKITTLLRNTCRRVAKLGKTAAPNKTLLLGAPLEVVRFHIENQFLPGMTWQNHGKMGWHIDHIRPLASFDLTNEEQIKAAAHYTNLAPLWAYDNWSKGSKTS